MTKGNLAIVLHAHLPYVRAEEPGSLEEDWFFQALAECYLPLLNPWELAEYSETILIIIILIGILSVKAFSRLIVGLGTMKSGRLQHYLNWPYGKQRWIKLNPLQQIVMHIALKCPVQ